MGKSRQEELESCLEQGLEEDALKIARRDSILLERLADYHESKGNAEIAKTIYREAAEWGRYCQDRDAVDLARCYDKAGEFREAAAWYLMAVEDSRGTLKLQDQDRDIVRKSAELCHQATDYWRAEECYNLLGDFSKALEMHSLGEQEINKI